MGACYFKINGPALATQRGRRSTQHDELGKTAISLNSVPDVCRFNEEQIGRRRRCLPFRERSPCISSRSRFLGRTPQAGLWPEQFRPREEELAGRFDGVMANCRAPRAPLAGTQRQPPDNIIVLQMRTESIWRSRRAEIERHFPGRRQSRSLSRRISPV